MQNKHKNLTREAPDAEISEIQNIVESHKHSSVSLFLRTKAKIKSFFRSIARLGFNILKPIVRPGAFRLRRYLIDGLRQDILQESQASKSLLQNISNSIGALQVEHGCSMDGLRQDILRESRVAGSLLQNISNSIGTLQTEHGGLINGLRQDLLQESQASGVLLQNISNSIGTLQTEHGGLINGLRQDLLQESQASSVLLQNISNSISTLQTEHKAFAFQSNLIERYSCASARRFAINCGSGEVLVRTEVGFMLCAADDHALLACLIETGDLEPGTRQLIQKFLQPGDVYVDVGANIGMHVLAAARALQNKGKIIAFEPFESTKRMLEKSVWINGFSSIIEIHQAAVSNITGKQDLYLGATSGHHSLFELDTSNSSKKSVEVPVVRLDGIIPCDQKIDLLKIDAEGAEFEVLEGAVSFIVNNPDVALIVEFGLSHLHRAGHTTRQWLAAFTKLGLNYRAINPYSGALEVWTVEQLEQTESINLFFARDNSRIWDKLST